MFCTAQTNLVDTGHGSRHKASSIVTDSGTLNAFELVHAHDQLPALTNDEVLALQLRQVLGDSGPRSPDEIGNILVAERSSQKRAARLFDSEIGSQFKQRNGNACMKIEVQETGAAQQQSAALLQIVLMKCLEGRLGARNCSSSHCRICNHCKPRTENRSGRMAAKDTSLPGEFRVSFKVPPYRACDDLCDAR